LETTDPQRIEDLAQFEQRKRDHIALSLSPENEAKGWSGLSHIELIHEALPDLNFSEVTISQVWLGETRPTPFFVSSMTAGHYDSLNLNQILAHACADRGWVMGVGSQRRELGDSEAAKEWRSVRKAAPKARLLGNLGLAQLIHTPTSQVAKLSESLDASAMIIHLNPLQECLQPEGTPEFRGGLTAIERLCNELEIPVVVKETGCGFSKSTLRRLSGIGVAAVDISGLGGTHWGRIEGQRSSTDSIQFEAAKTFSNWGVTTTQSVLNAVSVDPDFEIWASGGVRSGLDAAKLLAMGACAVGFAKPILEAALKGEDSLQNAMATIEYELKTALFCTGSNAVHNLHARKLWQQRQM